MRVLGKGNTAEVIEWDNDKVCKLFYEGYPHSAVEREYNNAKLIQTMDIPMPEVYEIVHVGVREGIIYDRLEGQSVLEKLLEGGDVNLLFNQIVDLHKKILGYNTCEVMSYKEFLQLCIGEKTTRNVDIYNEIKSLPDDTCLCHGDYHPGNIWMDTNNKISVIDFMNVCHGPWQYDVARTYVLISEGDVPQEVPNREKIIYMQKQLANIYLKKLHVSYNNISEYVSIIQKCREYELQY
ncbi:Phosphotransferase enzyme family protein [Clostridium cavendishii DSM 21758]|uniref:Phosphotransferase enzyme family protein n=1 Tax=Clostridium cavendishii DSM 21758 TaxID=1121302 RepID=A0A1M6MGK3_9CLOT|nr:aminoglycoside phosphotransferase family protein [Clostridium cavendishii]SHJ82602.1 Phosphotransferase enzyme family protein [Clostridium cavendishii DSM 21758]